MIPNRFVYSREDVAALRVIPPAKDYNECHNPPGSPEGGQFCSGPGAGSGAGSGASQTSERPADLGERMLEAVKKEGGFTFDPRGNAPKEGYAVGGYDGSPVYDLDKFSLDDVRSFLEANRDLLSSGSYHVGGWVDNGKVHLDITKVFSPNDRAAAVEAGKRNNQISIADLGKIALGDFDNAFIGTGGTGGLGDTGYRRMNFDATKKAGRFLLFAPGTTAEEIFAAVRQKQPDDAERAGNGKKPDDIERVGVSMIERLFDRLAELVGKRQPRRKFKLDKKPDGSVEVIEDDTE